MANYMESYIVITTTNKEDMDLLEKELDKAMTLYPDTSDFGQQWLGNLVLHIGRDYCDYNCKGTVLEYERTAVQQMIMTIESAWGPHVMCIKAFCDHFVKDAKVIYDCDTFITNDPNLVGKVKVRVNGKNVPEILESMNWWDEPAAQDEIRQELIKFLGHDGTYKDLKEEVEKWVENENTRRGPKDCISVEFNEYEFFEISEAI